jgi:hypothetical protein
VNPLGGDVKGILFNVVEEVVEEDHSERDWDLALCRAGVEGAYTSLGNYPTAQLLAILAALAEQQGTPVADVLRAAGEHGYHHLAARHPALVEPYRDLGDLLLHLDTVIHPEVLKLYPHADPPRFEVQPLAGETDAWGVTYRSARGLCHLAEGLMRGAADSFEREARIEQVTCRHRGDPTCHFEVRLGSSNPVAPGRGHR